MKNVFIIVTIAIFLIVFFPLSVIWALNVLFPVLNIEYSLSSWAAIVVLCIFIRSNITMKE